MLNAIVERLLKLLCVKSIVTLALTFAFIKLAICGVIGEAQVVAIFTSVIGFYFGTQSKKEGVSNGN